MALKINTITYILCLFFFFAKAQTQKQKINGTVRAAQTKLPMVGATVKIAGISTVTDKNGNFNITVTPAATSLTASYIGYLTQTITIDFPLKQSLVILLEPQAGMLEEVMVNTGFQQISRERATGSFVQINNQQLNRRVSTDLISRIENLVPGLAFNQTGTGTNGTLSIRGQSSISTNNQPLIVIDNFPYEGDLNTINPNDVESITILKDAAAASIWGAKAGNGVIVITTKKGLLNQKNSVTLNTSINTSARPDLFYQPKMAIADYIDIEKRRFVEGAYASAETATTKAALSPVVELLIAKREGKDATLVDTEIENLKNQDARNDISKYLNQRSINQQYALNMSGGGKNQAYFVSAAYDKNRSSDVGNSYGRININANNTYYLLNNKLSLTMGLYYTESTETLNNAGYTADYPYASLADTEGNPLAVNKYRPAFLQQAANQQLLDWTYQPLTDIKLGDNILRLTDYRVNAALQYELMPGIKARVLYQYGRGLNNNRKYQSQQSYYTRDQINKLTIVNTDGSLRRPIPLGGIMDRSNEERNSQNFRTQLDYNRSWSDKHQVYALAGAELMSNRVVGNTYRLYGYSDDYATSQIVDYVSTFTSYINPSSTNNKISNSDSQKELIDNYLSWYANAAYTYLAKYTLSGSIRLDQSNLFGVKSNQKGTPLYSAGASWLLSSEPFLQSAWLPYLKLRLTYGYNGNVNKSVSAFTTARILPTVNAQNNLTYAQIQNPPNPELRWERVKIINLGLDFKIKNDRITGSVEYYKKKGIDLIGTTPFAPATGMISFTGNYANISGQGFELNINTQNIRAASAAHNGFNWNTNFLFSYAADQVSRYLIKPGTATLVQSAGSGTYPVEGKPLRAIYSYRWAGLEHETGNPQGFLDGVVSKDYTKIMNAATLDNLVYHGPARPPLFGAVLNTFNYRSITLSANISYKFGAYFRENSISYAGNYGLASGHGDYSKRWKTPGDEAFTNVPSVPAANNTSRDTFYRNSSANIKKGDHLRLQDISLSYDLFNSIRKSSLISKANIYLYMNNIGILWQANDSDLDPEYALAGYRPVRSFALGFKIEL